MKQTWVTPRVNIQNFEANEYVAACWGVGCSVDAANLVEKGMPNTNRNNLNARNNYDGGQTHAGDGCGTSSNQFLRDMNGDNIFDVMQEYKSVPVNGSNWLPCTVYTDNSYTIEKSLSEVGVNDYIYWTTSATDGRIWYHQGTVQAQDTAHPNRS